MSKSFREGKRQEKKIRKVKQDKPNKRINDFYKGTGRKDY